MPNLSPELVTIFQNPEDPRNIFNPGSIQWEGFIKNILASIAGKETQSLPFAILNPDNSISISIHRCDEKGCEACVVGRAFDTEFKTEYLIEQLDYHRQRLGFPLVSENISLIQSEGYSEVTNVVTYRINLMPEHLDSLLKLSNQYAYRGENGILKLKRDILLKEGVLCLFPVAILDEHALSLRTAGCQTAEITSIQLLQRLRTFDGKVKPFHWDIQQVIDKIGVDRMNIEIIMNNLLNQSGMTSTFIYLQGDGGELVQAPTAGSSIKLVPLTADAKNIYLKYGNIGIDEIEHCLSAEIDIIDYLNAAKMRCMELKKEYKEYDSPKDVALQQLYVKELDEMIEQELSKRVHVGVEKESVDLDVPPAPSPKYT